MKAIRWSDNDKYFGPFTYSRLDNPRFAVVLGSGDDDDYPHCRLRMSVFKWTLIIALPPILKPHKQWVDTSKYEWSTSLNGGYYDMQEREYGFTYWDGYLSLHFGRQTNDSSAEQRKGYFLPWTQWRHVRTSHYGLQGEHYYTEPKSFKYFSPEYDAVREKTEATPSRTFAFADYDGEQLTATTTIQEREWRFGEGWFKWLSIFRKPKIRRSLDIRFSGEIGKRKGSWKGGTTGHGIEMLPGELHEDAFRRYCLEHDMTFQPNQSSTH